MPCCLPCIAVDGGRINIAACSVGGAQFCLDHAKDYVSHRKQFGRAVADFQATQFTLADMATSLQASRLMVRHAAQALDAQVRAGREHAALAACCAARCACVEMPAFRLAWVLVVHAVFAACAGITEQYCEWRCLLIGSAETGAGDICELVLLCIQAHTFSRHLMQPCAH